MDLSDDGRASLRTRADGAVELRVNGVFVMDDQETSSERLLARAVLDAADDPSTVVVGGLGLGHTLRELLADERVRRVVVAEIEPAVARWMREGRVPGRDLLDDPRTDLRVGDVRDVVASLPETSVDAVLLDVDNGPDFLVLDANAAVYGVPFLATCVARLRPGGVLCIWSMADSPALRDALAQVCDDVAADRVPVRLQGREEAYWLLRGRAPRGS
ncbi:spermidine synthase [Solicola sp. PLA-1-18]|uniref:spermidine synthase n=1 Tax=Solicola sp. PLA-1-18 TaxID=3380532 RepID=UPI003B7982F7